MMFLMNDAMLELDGPSAPSPPPAGRMGALTLDHVLKLGAELYAERPLLHRDDPERARRLALLVRAKAPEVNAALFVAPAAGCRPDAVIHRVAEVSVELMAGLRNLSDAGQLTPVAADKEVWRRMAA